MVPCDSLSLAFRALDFPTIGPFLKQFPSETALFLTPGTCHSMQDKLLAKLARSPDPAGPPCQCLRYAAQNSPSKT